MITGETLMAYADGELADEDRDPVEAALADNPQVQERLAEERLLRRSLLALYEPALNEEIPERLTLLLKQSASARPYAVERKSPVRRTWWHNVTAIAATLVLGILLGRGLATDSLPLGGDTVFVANGEVARALDVQLASTQGSDAPVQIGVSFIGPEGGPCRSFRTQNAVGLACRDDGRWALRLVAPFEPDGGFEYQQAGSATALIMQSAQELMAGDPMDAMEERSARDSGWASGAETR
ncbi:MAG TPA: hypothetical protein VMP01_09505 [Pirellulaceae bacterium]|nr:hypothetical protein [Pirellulaceae bacterium]